MYILLFCIILSYIIIIINDIRNGSKPVETLNDNNVQDEDSLFEEELKNFRHSEKLYKYTLKFLQPLIDEKEQYKKFVSLDNNKIKIFIKLLRKEFVDEVFLNHYSDDELSKTMGVYLRNQYFEISCEIFMKQFFMNNPKCNNSWSKIKDCYIDTFYSDFSYVPFIKHYLNKNKILSTPKIEESLKREIEKRMLEKDVNNYKNLIDNNKKYCEEIHNSYDEICDIDCMSGLDFEKYLKNLFVKLKYSTELTPASGDQGADLIIYKHNKKIVVQAKCYSSFVTNKAIQEVVAAIKYYHADYAMVVTNSYFTKSAIELAEVNNVELWDRNKLLEVISMT